MKKIKVSILLCILLSVGSTLVKAQTSSKPVQEITLSNNPWADDQLMEPSKLAVDLNTNARAPLIFNIGAVGDIKGARHIGAAGNEQNLAKLKESVASLPKGTAIIIYCGCCPFSKCPNVRPAFVELKNLGFTNVKVLDLPTNLKTDWIGKGYPLAGK